MNELMKLTILKMEGKNPEDFDICNLCHGYGTCLEEESIACSKCNGKGIINK